MAQTQTLYPLAHFKFGLIAPVIQGVYPDASAIAYYRRITKDPLVRPDGTTFLYQAKSLQHWERLYRNGGMDALISHPRKDKGQTRLLTTDCISEIYQLRNKYPRLPATQIHQKLIDDGILSANVSVRCIQRFFKTWDIKAGRPTHQKDRKAFEEEFFWGMRQADSCHYPLIKDENGQLQKTYLLLILDNHARMVVAAKLFFQDNSIHLQELLKKAVATYGIPNKFYTDSGAPYINQQFSLICGNIGTVLLHAPVKDGASKGKIERVFRTLKEKWLYGLDLTKIPSLDAFNQELTTFLHTYNLTVHSSTNQSPMDRFLHTKEKIKLPMSKEWLDECFRHHLTRKVRNDSTVKINHILYDVPLQFIRQTVDIRYEPGQPDDAYVLFDQKKFPIRKTNKVENGKTKRNKELLIDYSKATKGGEIHV